MKNYKQITSTIFLLVMLQLFLSFSLFSQQAQSDTFIVTKAGSKIKPAANKYLQYTQKANGLVMFQSLLTREIKNVIYEGREQLLIIQTYQSQKTIDKDSSYCDVHTLMPIAYYSDVQSEGHKEKVLFTKDKIDNTVVYTDSIKHFTKENAQRYNGVMDNEIISVMPLKPGATFVVRSVNPGIRFFEYNQTVIVEGKEELVLPGIGKIWCWRIKTSSRPGFSSTEWYSVKNKIQIKSRFQFTNGDTFNRILLTN
jgi:hypothetical protein